MLSTGTILANKLRIVRLIGTGGMGAVYEAVHLHLGRRVAVKLIQDDSQSRDARVRFIREARALALLPLNHIVQVLDVDVLPSGDLYMVMEFLDGRDLKRELRKRGSLPVEEAAMYVKQACEGVADAHDAGVIHRDLKPQNLFVTELSGNRRIKLLDFGAAKISQAPNSTLTGSSGVVGTLSYMAPEQLDGQSQADERCDIWALGVVLYELIAGRSPFRRGSPGATVHAVLLDEPESLRELRAETPPGLEGVVMRCLAKKPAFRYANARALAAALRPYATESNIVDPSLRASRGSSDPPPLDLQVPTEEELERRSKALVETRPQGHQRVALRPGGSRPSHPDSETAAETTQYGGAETAPAIADNQEGLPRVRRRARAAGLTAGIVIIGAAVIWAGTGPGRHSAAGPGASSTSRDPLTQDAQETRPRLRAAVPSAAGTVAPAERTELGASSALASASSTPGQPPASGGPAYPRPRAPKGRPASKSMPGDSVPLTL